MRGVAHLGHFREHHRSAGSHQQVRGPTHSGICRHSGEGVGAAALQAHDKVGGWTGNAPALVKTLQLLLRLRHDVADHRAKALIRILKDRDGRILFEHAQCAGGDHAGGLQFFATEADQQNFSAEVRIQAQVAQCADGNSRARRVDGHAAAVVMRDGDYIVHMGIVRQHLGLDAPHRVIHRCRHALHRGADGKNVLRSH